PDSRRAISDLGARDQHRLLLNVQNRYWMMYSTAACDVGVPMLPYFCLSRDRKRRGATCRLRIGARRWHPSCLPRNRVSCRSGLGHLVYLISGHPFDVAQAFARPGTRASLLVSLFQHMQHLAFEKVGRGEHVMAHDALRPL